MLKIAQMITAITSLFMEILPIFKSQYRRESVVTAFRTIIQALCDELEDESYKPINTKVFINPHGLTAEEIELALSKKYGYFNSKIAAIKAYRDRIRNSPGGYDIGLKEVKDIIEKFQADNSAHPSR